MDLFRSEVFAQRVNYLLKEHHAPGVAIALVHNDYIHSSAYGYASLDPLELCRTDTLFDIASCSKSFTSASIGLLVDDEESFPEIKYDAVMSDLLPGDFILPEASLQITLDDVVSHRTGMGRHDFSYMGIRAEKPDDARSITRNLRNLKMTAPPRTKEIYNNMMYTAAAYLVENKTNTPFNKYLEQKIFKPLGMNSTYLHPKNTRAAGLGDRIASGYSWLEDEKRYIPVSCIDMPEAIGAGNIMSSVDDAIKYIKAMIDHQSEPITESVYNGLVRGRMITDSLEDPLQPLTSPAIYASGWQVSYYRGHCVIEHDGSEAGYASVHFFLPDLKFGGVIYGNSGGIGYVGPVLKHELIDELLNVPKDERPDWNKIESGQKDEEEETDEAKIRSIYPDIKEIGAQEKPLDLYTGVYMNPGYHNVRVTIKNGNLFIDASDRSMGFYLRFQHVSGQTNYVAWQSDWLEGGDEPLKAEFKFGPDGGHANSVGIKLEGSMDELIYFDWQKEIA